MEPSRGTGVRTNQSCWASHPPPPSSPRRPRSAAKYGGLALAGYVVLTATHFALKSLGAVFVPLCATAVAALAFFELGVLLRMPLMDRKYSLLRRLADAAQARGVPRGTDE